MVSRLVGFARNRVEVKYRTWRELDQRYTVEGTELLLPPDHDLPFYQRRDPSYDTYAVALLRSFARGPEHVTVIDVGANVGDTAAAILGSDPETTVLCVEGSPQFVPYLRRNLSTHRDRATIVEGFVGPVGENVTFSGKGSTGGFQAGGNGAVQVMSWVSPKDLLETVPDGDFIVWKSDIDGFDIHVLAEHWEEIDPRCDVIWFEYDPPRTLGDRRDVQRLSEQLAASGRALWVYDNLGRLMVRLAPGNRDGLLDLTGWLFQQYEGHITTPYLDIWALSEKASELVHDLAGSRGAKA